MSENQDVVHSVHDRKSSPAKRSLYRFLGFSALSMALFCATMPVDQPIHSLAGQSLMKSLVWLYEQGALDSKMGPKQISTVGEILTDPKPDLLEYFARKTHEKMQPEYGHMETDTLKTQVLFDREGTRLSSNSVLLHTSDYGAQATHDFALLELAQEGSSKTQLLSASNALSQDMVAAPIAYYGDQIKLNQPQSEAHILFPFGWSENYTSRRPLTKKDTAGFSIGTGLIIEGKMIVPMAGASEKDTVTYGDSTVPNPATGSIVIENGFPRIASAAETRELFAKAASDQLSADISLTQTSYLIYQEMLEKGVGFDTGDTQHWSIYADVTTKDGSRVFAVYVPDYKKIPLRARLNFINEYIHTQYPDANIDFALGTKGSDGVMEGINIERSTDTITSRFIQFHSDGRGLEAGIIEAAHVSPGVFDVSVSPRTNFTPLKNMGSTKGFVEPKLRRSMSRH